MKTAVIRRLSLAKLDQRRLAISMSADDRNRLLMGRGIYEHDSELGPVLRVEFGRGEGELIFTEEDWDGEIVSGEHVGCDFLIQLN